MAISGVEYVDFETHHDARGSLVVMERRHGLPFDAKRIFYLFDCPRSSVRGQHAVSADMVMAAVSGSVCVDLDNGNEQSSQVLSMPNRAIHIRRGIWVRLRDFQPGTIVMVASAENYEDVTYSDRPFADSFEQSKMADAA
jgi:hypothetical protein